MLLVTLGPSEAQGSVQGTAADAVRRVGCARRRPVRELPPALHRRRRLLAGVQLLRGGGPPRSGEAELARRDQHLMSALLLPAPCAFLSLPSRTTSEALVHNL